MPNATFNELVASNANAVIRESINARCAPYKSSRKKIEKNVIGKTTVLIRASVPHKWVSHTRIWHYLTEYEITQDKRMI